MDGVGAFVEVLTKAGPWAIAALLFYFLRLEREERLQVRDEVKDLTKASIDALNGVKNALRALRFTLLSGRSGEDEDDA